MVFFNYSTMQMAAKVVYYGPGLCGKTTNLHYIYQHTTSESRGEMVSLETETDRTLFFDLLPIEVGQIGGFRTRIQLYTVPGQVFYNTTRKLVLKGVDGVVFVADSQRPMLQANVDSLRNLGENLAELGLTLDTVPVVLQYNKRDLTEICSVAELQAALNPGNWPHFEACAIKGQGVFETLKGISRLTLMSLKSRLAKTAEGGTTVSPAPPRPTPPPMPAAQVPPSLPRAKPAAAQPAAKSAPPAPTAAPVQAPAPAKSAPAATTTPSGKFRIDPLRQLETLRQQAKSGGASSNGQREVSRTLQLSLRREDWKRAKRVSFSLRVEDADHRVVEKVEDLTLDLDDATDAERLLLKLQIALSARD